MTIDLCVQCNRPIQGHLEVESMALGVCVRADCPNYGLPQIAQSKIDEFVQSLIDCTHPTKSPAKEAGEGETNFYLCDTCKEPC